MKIKNILALIVMLCNFNPAFAQAIDEGLYTDGTRLASVLKNDDGLVRFHLIEIDNKKWGTFTGYENSDGSVDVFTHDDDNSARWNISTTTEGVKLVRELCLGEDCDGGIVELSLALYLPDTGGSFSGLYQSLAFQNLIIHQVGKKAISIDLFENPDPNYTDYGFEIVRWDLVEDTLVIGNVIYTTYDDDLPFDGMVSAAISEANSNELIVTIDNCSVAIDADLSCEDFEGILSGKRVF